MRFPALLYEYGSHYGKQKGTSVNSCLLRINYEQVRVLGNLSLKKIYFLRCRKDDPIIRAP
jgi:hypothetical protein